MTTRSAGGGIQKSSGIGRMYMEAVLKAHPQKREQAGVNDSAGSGGVKAQRRTGSGEVKTDNGGVEAQRRTDRAWRAERKEMQEHMQTMVEMMRTSGEMS